MYFLLLPSYFQYPILGLAYDFLHSAVGTLVVGGGVGSMGHRLPSSLELSAHRHLLLVILDDPLGVGWLYSESTRGYLYTPLTYVEYSAKYLSS